MNERIKELKIKACKWASENVSQAEYENAADQKFAELIVKECVGLIRQQSIGEEVLGGQRYKTIQLGETIATITEHFGIEE